MTKARRPASAFVATRESTAQQVIAAIRDGRLDVARRLIQECDDPRTGWIETLEVLLGSLVDRRSATTRARAFLREQLGDGKRHSYRLIAFAWRAQSIAQHDPSTGDLPKPQRVMKDLHNAARLEGVISGKPNTAEHYYQKGT